MCGTKNTFSSQWDIFCDRQPTVFGSAWVMRGNIFVHCDGKCMMFGCVMCISQVAQEGLAFPPQACLNV